MNTFNDHVAAIRNIISKGAASKDLRITDRLIGHFLNIARSSLIDKFKSPLNYQTICFILEKSSLSFVCPSCIDLPETCNEVSRTSDPIPSVIITKDIPMESIIVRTIDGTVIGRRSATNNKYKQYSLSNTNKTAGWDIFNGHIVIFADRHIPVILVDVLAMNPEEVSILPVCTETQVNNTCSSGNQEYPINPKAVGALYDLTIKMLSMSYNFGEDSKSDARDLAIQVLRKSK